VRFRLFLVLAQFLILSVAAAEDSWTQIATDGSIRTYESGVLHDGYTKYRGVGRLDMTFDEAVAIIKDIPGTVHWLPRCRRSDEIRWISETSVILYVVSRAPWPFKDRDMVWRRDYLVDNDDRMLMTFEAIDDSFEGEPGTLRVISAHGEWEVRRIDGDTTEVRFEYVGESGGPVPKSFVDSNNKSLPRKVLEALQRRADELRAAPGEPGAAETGDGHASTG
jgi:hypothetical protein